MGEDLPSIGAIRNMRDPTLFGDPGKVSDPQFVCLTPGNDAGGVHSNSGVPNHAYALMVDGGTYNGQTVTPIGLTKAGKIQYRTLNTYLVSGSGFLDNYQAMQQACTDLVGTAGITAADCTQVKKALDAVEMANPVCAQPAAPALCPAGQSPTNLFFDNLENPTSGKWTTSTITGVNHWLDDATHTAFGGCTGTPDVYCAVAASSGTRAFWGYDTPVVGDSAVAMTANVAIPAGARMQFNHSYGFEDDLFDDYDGGVVEYSTNGGATWIDAGTLITSGRTYSGVIGSDFGNPLAGRNAFVRESFGYTASQLTLNSLSGQNVRFRFRMGTDSGVDDYGWFIDDVRVYTCTPARTLRISDVTKAEGNSGTTAFDFTVTLSAAAASNVTVTYATANGTAVAPGDYATLAPTVLTFTPGQTSKLVRVNVVGEGGVEANETFVVNLSAPSGATLADGQGRGTILNDDGSRLSITDVARTEGNSGTTAFVFTVTLGAVAASNVTVNCVTANGTATTPADYGAVNIPLVFTPGQTLKTCTVPVVGNSGTTGIEPNETFVVNLTNVTGPTTVLDGQGLGTILNDDGPVLSINNVTLTEGNTGTSNFNFTVTLSLAAATNVTVNCVAANGTAAAGSDYTAGTTALTFTPGQTIKTCTVPVVGDAVVEPNEYFVVNLTNAVGPATIVDGQGVGTILNNDGPLLRITDVTLTEGNAGPKSFNFLVTLSSPAVLSTNVTVNCVRANGTAVAPGDYTAGTTALTFTPGQTSKTCTVLVVGDVAVEPNETVFVNLTSPVGATIFDVDLRGIGTITNDD